MKPVTFFCLLGICLAKPQGSPDTEVEVLARSEERQCSEWAGQGYHCVPYYNCDECDSIIVDGTSLFDPRRAEENCATSQEHRLATTSQCAKQLHVCCRHPESPLPEDEEEEEYGAPEDLSCEARRGESGVVCNGEETDIGDAVFLDDNCIFDGCQRRPMQCGKRNVYGVDDSELNEANVGEARFGEWPHVCAIIMQVDVGSIGGTDADSEEVNVYVCGASLIAPQVVLTAGHCVEEGIEVDSLLVRCGEWDTQTEDEKYPFQERKVNTIVKHPGLDTGNHHNNFALLFLDTEFSLEPHISPVCLPKPDTKPFNNKFCVSHGWGKDKFGQLGEYQTRLKEVVVPAVSNDICQNKLRNTRLGAYYELDQSFICAGGVQGVDTCKGDGGSPLVCQQVQGTWYQAGIVSFGIGCGEQDVPAVYADVASASCWIDTQVSQLYNLGGESYFGFDDGDCNEFGLQ